MFGHHCRCVIITLHSASFRRDYRCQRYRNCQRPSSISADDEIPISQAGAARAASIGALLSSVQPVITVDSPSLLGRKSLGSGSPEQIDIGAGLTLTDGTLVANSLNYAAFPTATRFSAQSDLVVASQGSPMLMPASLLRGLFSAGQNVAIDPNGVISSHRRIVRYRHIGELIQRTADHYAAFVPGSGRGQPFRVAGSHLLR